MKNAGMVIVRWFYYKNLKICFNKIKTKIIDNFQLVGIWGVVAMVGQGLKMAKDHVLGLFGVKPKSIEENSDIENKINNKLQPLMKKD